MRPAPADHGIWFRRVDVEPADGFIPASWEAVQKSPLCTLIANEAGVSVSTIEHLMAALAGCGVHNALIEIDGPEVPAMDGSSALFVQGILKAGLTRLSAPLTAIEVLKPVEVRAGDAYARLEPENHLWIDFSIDFEDAAIGHQEKSLDLANGTFVHELCDSRTFCRQADVDTMQANGLALGGAPGKNAVVFDGDQVMSPGGLRHADEPVRHKMLDALGDLALAGRPLLARYTGVRAGHAMTNGLLRALFADPTAYRVVTCDDRLAEHMPGVGVSQADLATVALQ